MLSGYVMKTPEGKYLGMDGSSTDDWFKASKFDKDGIKQRKTYLECGYELVGFEVKEYTPLTCKNKCSSELNAVLSKEGLFLECDDCQERVHGFNINI